MGEKHDNAAELARVLTEHFDNPRGGVEERIDMDIRRHRMGWGRFVFTGPEGAPMPGVKIRLVQKKHEFLFGCNLFMLHGFPTKSGNAAFEKHILKVFNHATIPFYWDTLEPVQGKPRYGKDSPKIERRPPTDVAVEWCLENGVRPKGHWLFCDNFVPGWLPKNGRDLMILLEKRIAQLAERYGETVTIWDAVNEAFSNNRRFHPTIGWSVTPQDYVYEAFKLAEKYFPNYAEMCYNDGEEAAFRRYCRDNTPLYLLAKGLMARNVRLGGLGMQFHMYGPLEHMTRTRNEYFNPVHQMRVLDQYARLGIPLHMTEISLPTYPELPRKQGEALQAKLLRAFYRLWFSHPAMKSIVWWNLVDKTAYATESVYDAGLISKDMGEKPAFVELDRLVNKEWHTETTVETDERGIADWNGFFGEYDVEITVGRTVEKQTFTLHSDGENETRIQLK